ncbi:MAG: phosphoglucosamine mutase, partial [Gaiellaceae bacterium]
PERLARRVLATKANLGLAFDGDGDRLIAVDEAGEVRDGDYALAICGRHLGAGGRLKGDVVVTTVMANLALDRTLTKAGIGLAKVAVGDRYVLEEMLRIVANLGGEQSGHLILLDHSTTGDGLVAALAALRLMVERQRPLSELKRVMTHFPQVLLNVRVKARRDLDGIEPVRRTIARVRAALNDRGRVLVRYSGTEPLVRVMVEGEDAGVVQQYAEEIAAVIGKQLAD